MSSGQKETGAEFLVRKSDLSKTRQGLPKLTDILIVDDETRDSNKLIGTLRSMFGYDLEVRHAPTLNKALDAVLERVPQLVLLDDILQPSDRATDSIPMIRHARYEGPIVVISGVVDRQRRAELLAKGATDTIHKDDLNSVTIGEVLMRLDWSHIASGTPD